jgi:uncharacterized protein (TIGR02145 family)
MKHYNQKNSFWKFCMLFVLALTIGCNKNDDEKPVIIETGTMTDIDGNIYKTVKIGNQWCMAENLDVTHYRNGDLIPELSDSADWVSQTTGAYCIYDNGAGGLIAPGLLYSWSVISNPSIVAPAGWHIPSDDEWKQLEKTLGMSQQEADKFSWRGSDQADKLKSNDQNDWSEFGDVFSTNESGFTALAGSCRLFNSNWGDPGLKNTGFWWTSTSFDVSEAIYRYLDYKNSNVFRSHTDQHYGFSIRCVRD